MKDFDEFKEWFRDEKLGEMRELLKYTAMETEVHEELGGIDHESAEGIARMAVTFKIVEFELRSYHEWLSGQLDSEHSPSERNA